MAKPNRKKMETNNLRKAMEIGLNDSFANLNRTKVRPQKKFARIMLI
jgi:hypothetical protein